MPPTPPARTASVKTRIRAKPAVPGEQRRDRDQPGGPRDAGGEATIRHRAGRPQASSSRSPGVDSMTRVKETFSEARVSPASTARAARRPRTAGAPRAGRCRRGRPRRWRRCRRAWRCPRGRGRARRARRRSRRQRAGCRPVATGEQQREGRQHGDLEGATGAQVEQVGQVRGAGDHGATDEGVEGAHVVAPPVGERGGDQAGGADADDLHQPGRHPALRGGTEVALQPLAGAVAGEVVEGPEGPRAQHRHHPGRPARGRPQRGAGDVGRALEQGDRVTGVVAALPARRAHPCREHAVRGVGAGRGERSRREGRDPAHDAGMGA